MKKASLLLLPALLWLTACDQPAVEPTPVTTSAGARVAAAPTRDDHLALGNPSGATASSVFPTNYLLVKPQYSGSYHQAKGTANWVSWHLSQAWLGSTNRQDNFRPDASLPAGWYRVTPADYVGSGFDRGHLCPSGDRTGTAGDNSATFLMTNMVPQAPNNNQRIWEQLESYCRSLAKAGNELYIVAGPSGSGGSGSNGGTTRTLASGKVTVPASVWKVVVVLPVGSGDPGRVSPSTRVIAVRMPNTQSVSTRGWEYYRTSVDELERLTGYDFLSRVPVSVQAVVEARVDGQSL
ncbi:MAG: DNA/RNA non-specific endonuclease [Ferruginibacter sp.]|nr:DNA/RNA non-specific endonuclease [Cytophagales bacterium]